ncbi:MAG: hypothetical protein WDZ40_03985 [Candidatus Spechtbacterales bacterium]
MPGTEKGNKMFILNLTQHAASPEQVEAGAYEPQNKELVQKLLTFEELPTPDEVSKRARVLAALAREEGVEAVMIGGAPFLMPQLEYELAAYSIQVLYAFSRRESVEETDPETGESRKISVFRHLGFYEAQTGQAIRNWMVHANSMI